MFFNVITKAVNGLIKQAKNHAPEILLGAGLAVGVVSTIEACKASRKVDPILDEHKENVEKIKNFYDDKQGENYKKAITKQYVDTGKKIIKLYGKSFTLGGLSVMSILSAFSIQDRRLQRAESSLASMTALCTAMGENFDSYRKRVANEVGDEKEKDLYFNRHTEEVIEVVKDENGNEVTVARKEKVYDGTENEMVFTRVFANAYTPFADDRDPFHNKIFLSGVQDTLNSLGKDRQKMFGVGVVTYNEILDRLGFPPVDYGYTMGVRFYESKLMNPYGDNQIDLGLGDVERNTEFINELTGSVFLSINVDRTPLTKIPNYQKQLSTIPEGL